MSDVRKWLESLGLGQYGDAFEDHAIDWEVLSELDHEVLKEIGVAAAGHRLSILKAAKDLDGRRPSSASSVSRDAAPAAALVDSAPERRQLTVMFCDLVDSVALGERMELEDYRDLLGRFRDAAVGAVQRHDGFVARHHGDGLLVYFGYPQAREDDPERAVRAGLDVVNAIEALQQPYELEPKVRVGIATGDAVVGDMLDADGSPEFAALGTTPNLAARLQGAAEPNGVLVSDLTSRLVAGRFELKSIDLSLKGIPRPVHAFVVTGEAKHEPRMDRMSADQLTPLVGREEDIALLMRSWRLATEGEGQVVLLGGEAGVGKSRLVREVRRRIGPAARRVLRIHCSPRHRDRALYPVVEALEEAVAAVTRAPAHDQRRSLDAWASGVGLDAEEVTPWLAALLTAGDYPAAEPHTWKQKTFEALLTWWLEAQGLPALIVVEDAHWLDPSTAELLGELFERMRQQSLLVLVTHRPDFVAPWGAMGHLVAHTLGGLSRRETASLAREAAGEVELSNAVLEAIVDRTDGLPLYAEEVTRSILEAGLRTGESPEDVGLVVPATLKDSLMARLDRLGEAKRTAQAAAVLGRTFSARLLGEVDDEAFHETEARLETLMAFGLIQRDRSRAEGVFRFKHALIQDTAYESLLRARRNALHARAARALESGGGTDATLVAHHWASAGELERAFTAYVTAGERATAEVPHADWEALEHYWNAMTILESLPLSPKTGQRKFELVRRMMSVRHLGASAFWRSDRERARTLEHIESAIEWVRPQGRLSELALLTAFKGDHWMQEDLLTEAVELANESGDQRVQAEVASRNAGYYGNVGRFEDSRVHVERSIALSGEIGSIANQGFSMAAEGRCYFARAGWFEQSREFARRAREIALETGDRRLQAWGAMEAEPYMYQGHWALAIERANERLPLAWEIGEWNVVLFASAWAAVAYVKLARLEEADAVLRPAIRDAYDQAGGDHPRIYPLVALSQLELAQGAPEAAADAASKGLALAERTWHGLERGAALRELARACAALADHNAARNHFRRSLEVLGDIQCRPELAQSMNAFGMYLLDQEPSEGKQLLEQSLELFESIRASGWAEETRAALAG